MRTTFLVRIPLEYRAKVLQEGLRLGLDSTLETMRRILSDYFDGNQPHKAETASDTAAGAVTEQKPPLETTEVTAQGRPAETTPVTEVTQPVTEVTTTQQPRTLYGGVIHVA